MDAPWTIARLATELRRGSFSAAELVDEALRRADRLDGILHVYVTRFDEAARAAARAADLDFAAGVDRGPLQGIPIGVKDLMLTKEAPTAAGTAVRNPAWQRRADARVVARLRAAGAVITGKTVTAELAIGVPDEGHLERETRNPWARERWAGGSSAGSAAGVAAGMFAAGIGTDTGGSVRIPAAYCGLSGSRPSTGRVSRAGVIPLAPSLDVVGPICRTAEDTGLLFHAMSAAAGRRTESSRRPRSLSGLRIGVDRVNHLDRPETGPDVAARFEDAVDELERAGATIREIELPCYDAGVHAVLVTIFAEACATHRRELREQWRAFAPATRQALATGFLVTGADYVASQRVRALVKSRVALLYRAVDLVVCPTTLSTAPELRALSLDALTRSICTDYWSGVGNPVLSIPIGFDGNGLPVGMQVAGRRLADDVVIGAAEAYQRRTDWHLHLPPLVEALQSA